MPGNLVVAMMQSTPETDSVALMTEVDPHLGDDFWCAVGGKGEVIAGRFNRWQRTLVPITWSLAAQCWMIRGPHGSSFE